MAQGHRHPASCTSGISCILRRVRPRLQGGGLPHPHPSALCLLHPSQSLAPLLCPGGEWVAWEGGTQRQGQNMGEGRGCRRRLRFEVVLLKEG